MEWLIYSLAEPIVSKVEYIGEKMCTYLSICEVSLLYIKTDRLYARKRFLIV